MEFGFEVDEAEDDDGDDAGRVLVGLGGWWMWWTYGRRIPKARTTRPLFLALV